MTTQQEIERLEKDLKDLKKRLDGESGAWEPKDGGEYYYANPHGDAFLRKYNDDYVDQWNLTAGNCYRTEKGAQMHKLRRESMKRGFLPKKGEEYYSVSTTVRGYKAVQEFWYKDSYDLESYNLGRTFKTEPDANDWIKKYGEAWRFVEGE